MRTRFAAVGPPSSQSRSATYLFSLWENAMFTKDQVAAFKTQGFVRLPSAVPADDIRDMHPRLWSLLEQKGA